MWRFPLVIKIHVAWENSSHKVSEDDKIFFFILTSELQMSLNLEIDCFSKLTLLWNCCSAAEGLEMKAVWPLTPCRTDGGIRCSECQHSYAHCQRICKPLSGYWPWPYDCRRFQVSCRMIMPCRWWAAHVFWYHVRNYFTLERGHLGGIFFH